MRHIEVGEDSLWPVVLVWLRRSLETLLIHPGEVVDLLSHELKDSTETTLICHKPLLSSKVLPSVLIVDVLERGKALNVTAVLSIPEEPLHQLLHVVLTSIPSVLCKSLFHWDVILDFVLLHDEVVSNFGLETLQELVLIIKVIGHFVAWPVTIVANCGILKASSL